jgi:hypothetical protein
LVGTAQISPLNDIRPSRFGYSGHIGRKHAVHVDHLEFSADRLLYHPMLGCDGAGYLNEILTYAFLMKRLQLKKLVLPDHRRINHSSLYSTFFVMLEESNGLLMKHQLVFRLHITSRKIHKRFRFLFHFSYM